jgi:hypothetical protein
VSSSISQVSNSVSKGFQKSTAVTSGQIKA